MQVEYVLLDCLMVLWLWTVGRFTIIEEGLRLVIANCIEAMSATAVSGG